MAFSQSSSSLAASPNITPLIDVLLVLLIIFMVIVPMAPTGLSASVPQPPDRAALATIPPLVLEVLPAIGGGVSYRIGQQTLDRAGLLRSLQRASARSARPEMFIAGDERLVYQQIADAVAAAHGSGFHVVGLMHLEQP